MRNTIAVAIMLLVTLLVSPRAYAAEVVTLDADGYAAHVLGEGNRHDVRRGFGHVHRCRAFLHCCHANAQPGKRSRPCRRHHPFEVRIADPVARQQIGKSSSDGIVADDAVRAREGKDRDERGERREGGWIRR